MPNLKVQRFIYRNLNQRPAINKALNVIGRGLEVFCPYSTGLTRNKAALFASNNSEEIQSAKVLLLATKKDRALRAVAFFDQDMLLKYRAEPRHIRQLKCFLEREPADSPALVHEYSPISEIDMERIMALDAREAINYGIFQKDLSWVSDDELKLRQKEDQLIRHAEAQGLSGHGVNGQKGGIKALVTIMLQGRIGSDGEDPYRAPFYSGGRGRCADSVGGNGPYYVVLNNDIPGNYFGPISETHHKFYLVPTVEDKKAILDALDDAQKKSLLTIKELETIKGKTITYDEFLSMFSC